MQPPQNKSHCPLLPTSAAAAAAWPVVVVVVVVVLVESRGRKAAVRAHAQLAARRPPRYFIMFILFIRFIRFILFWGAIATKQARSPSFSLGNKYEKAAMYNCRCCCLSTTKNKTEDLFPFPNCELLFLCTIIAHHTYLIFTAPRH